MDQKKIIIFIGKFSEHKTPDFLRQQIQEYLNTKQLWYNIQAIRRSSRDQSLYAFVEVFSTAARSLTTHRASIGGQLVKINIYNRFSY